MKVIKSKGYQIEIGSLSESTFCDYIANYKNKKIVILCDENTHEKCVSGLVSSYDELSDAEILVIPAGEESKQLEIVESVWSAMLEYKISRYDLLINVGGGVISDFGGFAASCYKRGIDYINIPTSLLAMVDASIGGKTGINIGSLKNQIGVFSNPGKVYVDLMFLETLPQIELLNGIGEMLKHAILDSKEKYNSILRILSSEDDLTENTIIDSIEVKQKIVEEDPFENGSRKILNLGHTIGHGIESLFIESDGFKHGHCVVIGVVLEAFISMKKGYLAIDEFNQLENQLLEVYPMPEFSDSELPVVIQNILNDKKNQEGKILSCGIKSIGNCFYDLELKEEDVLEALLHYKNQQINLN